MNTTINKIKKVLNTLTKIVNWEWAKKATHKEIVKPSLTKYHASPQKEVAFNIASISKWEDGKEKE